MPEEVDHHYTCCICGAHRAVPCDKDGLALVKSTKFFKDLKIACPKCEGRYVAHKERISEEHRQAVVSDRINDRIKTWIPLIYQESDTDRFPQAIWQTHQHWIPGQKGLLFYGPHRTFKSRIAYAIAMHHAKLGTVMECYDPRSFRAMIERRINEKSLWDWYRNGALSPLFLLDDLGKFRGEGRRIEEEVYNLVKVRHEAKLGMIVTTNCGDDELAGMFSPAIGIAIVERLREMCKAVPFGKHQRLTPESEVSQVDLHNADL